MKVSEIKNVGAMVFPNTIDGFYNYRIVAQINSKSNDLNKVLEKYPDYGLNKCLAIDYYQNSKGGEDLFFINSFRVNACDENLSVFEKMSNFFKELTQTKEKYPETKKLLDKRDYEENLLWGYNVDDPTEKQHITNYAKDMDNIKDIAQKFIEGINTTMKKYFEG